MRFHWKSLLAAGLVLKATALVAAEPAASGKTPPPPAFKVSTSVEPAGSGVTVVRVYVFTETNRFTFVLPTGLRIQSDPATKKVSLIAIDGNCAITMQLDETIGQPAAQLNAATLREVVIQKHSGGKIIGESTVTLDGKSGPAFDLQWRSGNAIQTSRIGRVPVPGGSVEFALTATTDKFAGQQNYLNQLLLWMRRSDLKGELALAKILPPE